MYNLKTLPLESVHPKTYMCGVSGHFEHIFLVKIEFNFSIAFPIGKPYLFLKIHKVVFDHEELLKITWKILQAGFWHANHNGGD